MGLDNIFKLTNRKDVRMQLRIDLEYKDGQKRIVGYDNFLVETQVCKLLVACYQLWNFKGRQVKFNEHPESICLYLVGQFEAQLSKIGHIFTK